MKRSVCGIEYELTYKKVKNLNLRVVDSGEVRVSAAKRVPLTEIDRFVASRADWIAAARTRMAQRGEAADNARDTHTDAECLAVFTAVSDRIYPIFAAIVPAKPEIRARWMKSRWGVCHVTKNYITLNKQLMEKPAAALEYVVLHEYVHFLHPNHQKGFHETMARLMPDYKRRKALLSTDEHR